ncbi:MAG: aspartate 1-decarboxylase, partial [Fidelibacterota bacterium]
AADVVEYEKVDVYDITNGPWFSTYVTEARPGEICINGATARLVETGDLIIIASYSNYDETESDDHQARLIAVDEHNRILRQHSKEPGR